MHLYIYIIHSYICIHIYIHAYSQSYTLCACLAASYSLNKSNTFKYKEQSYWNYILLPFLLALFYSPLFSPRVRSSVRLHDSFPIPHPLHIGLILPLQFHRTHILIIASIVIHRLKDTHTHKHTR